MLLYLVYLCASIINNKDWNFPRVAGIYINTETPSFDMSSYFLEKLILSTKSGVSIRCMKMLDTRLLLRHLGHISVYTSFPFVYILIWNLFRAVFDCIIWYNNMRWPILYIASLCRVFLSSVQKHFFFFFLR